MNHSFKPGDPVLIINGLDAIERELVGRSTTVLSRLIGAFHEDDLVQVHQVEESRVILTPQANYAAAGKYFYRPCDLMPLDGYEPSEEEQNAELEKRVMAYAMNKKFMERMR